MSVKVQFLQRYPDDFLENVGAISQEQMNVSIKI